MGDDGHNTIRPFTRKYDGAVSEPQPFDRGLVAIGRAEVALAELDANCCVPGRSPRMARLGETLSSIRTRIRELGEDPAAGDDIIAGLEDAGAQIGSLQIGCCAPSRLPFYTKMLKELSAAQRSLSRGLDRGH